MVVDTMLQAGVSVSKVTSLGAYGVRAGMRTTTLPRTVDKKESSPGSGRFWFHEETLKGYGLQTSRGAWRAFAVWQANPLLAAKACLTQVRVLTPLDRLLATVVRMAATTMTAPVDAWT